MKTIKFISNSFGSYLFEHQNFLNIVNKTSLKTSIFSLFIINLIFSIIGGFIFKIVKSTPFVETLISIIIASTIGFLFLLFIIFIYSAIVHVFYKLFKGSAKLKNLVKITISINIVFFILGSILGGILIYLIKNPNTYFHKLLFTLFVIFNFILVLWYFLVSIENFGKVEKISKTKSLFAFSIIFFVFLVLILFFKLKGILIYLKSVYGF